MPQGTAYAISIPPMKISWEPKIEEKENMKERTFIMIKPDAFERGLVGEVLDLITNRGLNLVAFKTVQLTPEDCEKHYSHHVGKDFYPKLVEFMTSGPSLAMVFEGVEAASVCRQLIGNSKHPSQVQAGSIRGRYALDFPRNLIHGSDSYEDARRELRIYLTEEDIFDEQRVNALKAEAEEKRAAVRREYERKIEEGIKLGDEAFAPEVLQEGDWLVSRKGISLVKKVERFTSPDAEELVSILHEDYYNGWWKQDDRSTAVAGVCETSDEYSWAGSPLFLVGRDGQFLSKFVSPPIKDANGKRYVFKDGRWLPYFKKKSKPKIMNVDGNAPFAKILEDTGDYLLSDVYDPMNQIVMRVMSNDTTTKWRVMLGGSSKDITPMGFQQKSTTSAIVGFRHMAKQAPGALSILLYFGKPYAASYGDGKWYTLMDQPDPYAPKKKIHKVVNAPHDLSPKAKQHYYKALEAKKKKAAW